MQKAQLARAQDKRTKTSLHFMLIISLLVVSFRWIVGILHTAWAQSLKDILHGAA